jgi:hypothetical protein
MKVWIVIDQDDGDNASTVEHVFTSLYAAKQWMLEHADEAFGHYSLATPVGWDGTDGDAGFEVQE